MTFDEKYDWNFLGIFRGHSVIDSDNLKCSGMEEFKNIWIGHNGGLEFHEIQCGISNNR